MSGGLGVVLACYKNRAAFVPICHDPATHHRADLRPSWVEAALLDLGSADVIRCTPFVKTSRTLHVTCHVISEPLMARILHAVTHERRMQDYENGHSGRKWSIA